MNQYHIETNGTIFGGVQKVYKFPNGYGASVIKHDHSYGGSQGLWELAVLDKDGELTYKTPITSDVIGWLTDEEVDGVLAQINELTEEVVPSERVESCSLGELLGIKPDPNQTSDQLLKTSGLDWDIKNS